MNTGMRDSGGWRVLGGMKRDMIGIVGVTGEPEEEVEELSQDILATGVRERGSLEIGWHTGTRALQVPVSIRVR